MAGARDPEAPAAARARSSGWHCALARGGRASAIQVASAATVTPGPARQCVVSGLTGSGSVTGPGDVH